MKKKKDLSKITFMGIAFPSIVSITFIFYILSIGLSTGVISIKDILLVVIGLIFSVVVFSIFTGGAFLILFGIFAHAPILFAPVAILAVPLILIGSLFPSLQIDLDLTLFVFLLFVFLMGISIIISAVKAKHHGRYLEDMSDFVTGSHYEATFQSNGNVRIDKVNDYASSNFFENALLYILRFYKILFLGVFIYIIYKIKQNKH